MADGERTGVEKPLAWFAVLLSAATFAWLASRLPRGLEMTDESFYLLYAVHADSVRFFFTPTHWVSGALWKLAPGLMPFRAIGLGLSVVSSLLLGWGVLRIAPLAGMPVPAGRTACAALLATTAAGAMLYGSLLPFTPSYNLLGSIGACLSMGLGLLSITADRPVNGRLLAALAGTALGITALCKFSTGICTAGLLALLQLAFLWPRHGRRFDPLVVAACMAATVALAVLLGPGLDEAQRQFRTGLAMIRFAQPETTWERLVRGATDMTGLLTGVVLRFWGPLLCLALGTRGRSTLWGWLGAAWFALLLATGDHLSAGMERHVVQALPVAAALALGLLALNGAWMASWRASVLVATLVAMPVSVALGTGNSLRVQILTALAPWGALLGLLAFAGPRPRPSAMLLSLLFSMAILMQIVGNGADPYRMRPAREQVQPATLGPLGKLRVDAPTAAMATELKRAAARCGVAPGSPFLDFYNLPGVALVLDLRPVESPWLLDQAYATQALQRAEPAVLRRAVIAVKLTSSGARPGPPSQIADFPRGFKLCGRAVGPWDGLPIELWAPG